jgi:site-specific DNA-methyltransferase (adenine-specific)
MLGRIHRGDCVVGLRKLRAESVDLAFADPPFNIGYDYDVYDDRRGADEYVNWSRQWIEGVRRVLKPGGTFWLAIGDEFAAELKVLCTGDLGLHCRSWVVWFYTFGVHCKQKFTRSHAHLFHFVRDPKKFTFNSLAVRVPSARELVYGDKRADPDGRVPDDTWMMAPALPAEVPTRDGFILRPQDIPERFPPDSDTWFYSRVAGTFNERSGWHGCQMPEQLLGRIIRACSNEGDIVLDPFSGSGTTLAVAKKLRRSFLGFELSKQYARNIERRLAAITPGDPLTGPENPVESAPRTHFGRQLVRNNNGTTTTAKSRRSVIQRVNAMVRQVAVERGEIDAALIKAYLDSCDGYAVDRVIVDPQLNSDFLQACGRRHLSLNAIQCNRRLLGLRKSGKLSSIPKPRRTLVPWRQLETFAFASEIAWRVLEDREGDSLDDIFCNPALADEFDKIAQRFEPGHSAFEYRWAALALRKQVSKRRASAAHERIPQGLRLRLSGEHCIFRDSATARIDAVPGMYSIRHRDDYLYIGDTENLQARIQSHQKSLTAFGMAIGNEKLGPRSVVFATAPIPDSQGRRWGIHCRLIQLFDPRLNVPRPAQTRARSASL